MRLIACLFILLVSAAVSATATDVARQEHQSVGLVLSGGGSKGVAHIGVIQALEDNNIPIDYITGTSMGAIVGGLYACGYTPAEMVSLILSKPFSYWSTGTADPALMYYFVQPKPTPELFSLDIPTRRDSVAQAREHRQAQPMSLISPTYMSFGFMDLFSAYTAQCQGDFDRLMVPLRLCTSDVIGRRKKVLSHGQVGDAIRSSMSFPIVFQPTLIDSILCYDGGIYDNFPVDVMTEEFAPSIMIGVDVSTPNTDHPVTMMEQLDVLIMQNNDYSLPPEKGIKLYMDLTRFGLLEFPKAREIYEIGYRSAMAMMDSIKSRVTTRTTPTATRLRRQAFKARTPFFRVDSVAVHGGSPDQNAYLNYLFRLPQGDTTGIGGMRDRFYRALSEERIKEMEPRAFYNDSTGCFRVDVRAAVKDRFKAGIGGYITSSDNSYLYLNAGYSSLSFTSMSAKAEAWVGQSYLGAMLTGRAILHSRIPSSFSMEAVAWSRNYHESDRLFFSRGQSAFLRMSQYFGRLRWSTSAGRRGRFDVGLGAGYLRNSFYEPLDPVSSSGEYQKGRTQTHYTLGQVFAGYESTTLDSRNLPTAGYYRYAKAMANYGDTGTTEPSGVKIPGEGNQFWFSFSGTWKRYFGLTRKWILGIEGAAELTTRHLPRNYYSAITFAPGYTPTAASDNYFNPALHADNYLAAGITPIYKISSSLSVRATAHLFMPLRAIEGVWDAESNMVTATHGRWFHDPRCYAEADIVYHLPFADISAYGSYTTTLANSHNRHFAAGIAVGIYLPAPSLLR